MAETIEQLKKRLNQFQALEIPENAKLRERVLLAYHNRTLGKLHEIFDKPFSVDTIDNLQQFLEENWTLIKGSSLSYTALPDYELTGFLSEIAELIVQEKNKHIKPKDEPLGVVKMLMPTLKTDSNSENYPPLGPELETSYIKGKLVEKWISQPVDIRVVLRTHILDKQGLSLLPLKLCTELDLSIPSQTLANPYYDYKSESMDAHINEAEQQRFSSHSASAQALFEAKKQYEILVNDQSNLLGHLRRLLRLLYFNSADGVGEESNAGQGTYAAIINFNTYYDTLRAEEKARIPAGLKAEIDKLLDLSSNSESNMNATENIQTCIAMRRSSIQGGDGRT